MSRLIITLCLIAGVGGCATRSDQVCGSGLGSPLVIFTLFLGKAIPGRGDLTDKEWQTFLDATVTANLPAGYTVFDADGGWMNPLTHKSVQERTKVLLVALPDQPDSLAAVNRIRTAYQVQFQQQLVGMTVEQGCGEF